MNQSTSNVYRWRMPTASKERRAPTAKKPTAFKPSVGAKVLKDLKLTDAELAAFLPAKPWGLGRLRAVFWCQFKLDKSVDEVAAMFGAPYKVRISADIKDPPRSEGAVRNVVIFPPGRYCVYNLIPMRGKQHNVAGSFQLQVTFRSLGTAWASNHAIYERFKAIELARIGARSIRELTT
jgi:hypothetical protein